jgi:hypothetical protein
MTFNSYPLPLGLMASPQHRDLLSPPLGSHDETSTPGTLILSPWVSWGALNAWNSYPLPLGLIASPQHLELFITSPWVSWRAQHLELCTFLRDVGTYVTVQCQNPKDGHMN